MPGYADPEGSTVTFYIFSGPSWVTLLGNSMIFNPPVASANVAIFTIAVRYSDGSLNTN
jgi:hypothetical protein